MRHKELGLGFCLLLALVLGVSFGLVGGSARAAASTRSGVGRLSSGFGSNWTVYHENYVSSGVDPAGTDLSPLRRAWRSPTLDGSLFGEPLVYGGRVVIATTNDTIYELSAHSGAILWHHHYAKPVPPRDLACSGDVDPTVGITGTPVIDPARNEIFAVADERATNGKISHHLLGVNLDTGRVKLNEVADVPGRPAKAELQRPALTLDRGQVIIGYGGNDGDCGNYTGAIVAVPEGGGPRRVYTVEPKASEREGAVWQGGGAPLVDSSGGIWFATGNGSQTGDPYDYSDSVTELSPTLARERYFAPSSWANDNATDADLGSAAPAFVDGYVFQVGKGLVAYLLNPSHLGGIGGQVDSMPVCNGDPHGGLAVQGDTVYVGCSDGIWAIGISKSSPHMRVLWTNSSGSNGAPIVAGGLVWSMDGENGTGTLYGINPANGNQVVSKPTNGEDTHFPTPTVADGLLLAPAHHAVYAFMGPAGPPPKPH
jgi:PQQ-like domain